MEWLKKHTDAMMVLSGIVGTVIWMNGKFNQIDKSFSHVEMRFISIDKDISFIRSIMVIKGIMPEALAKESEQGK